LQVSVDGLANLTVTVLSPLLRIDPIDVDTLLSMDVHGGASGDANGTDENPVLNVANGFAGLTGLHSLSFSKINFDEASVLLTVSDTLSSLKVESTNVDDVSLNVSSASQLTEVEFSSNPNLKTIPKCLYERQYKQTVTATVVLQPPDRVATVSAEAYHNLTLNINNGSSSFELGADCSPAAADNGTNSGALEDSAAKLKSLQRANTTRWIVIWFRYDVDLDHCPRRRLHRSSGADCPPDPETCLP